MSKPETVNSVPARRQDDPKYKQAEDNAASIVRMVHDKTPFLDEDSYREYYRECREDIYADSWSHDYF